jgi:hypothetical protein
LHRCLCPLYLLEGKNTRTVDEALLDNNWLLDIRENLSEEQSRQCVSFWISLEGVERDHLQLDKFIWIGAKSGSYSAKDTYQSILISLKCFTSMCQMIFYKSYCCV